MAGAFETKHKGLVTFLLPAFSLTKQVQWTFHIDDRTNIGSTYDMIIGRDLLHELGITINFDAKTLTWETDTILMKSRGHLKDKKTVNDIFLTANEPTGIQDEFARATQILDANYHAANLNEVVNCTNTMNIDEKRQFKDFAKKSVESLFATLLGTITNTPARSFF